MTSAFAVGVTAMCVAIAFLTGLALWWAFQDTRDSALERAEERAARRMHRARHDLVAALGTAAQRDVEAPTGPLEPTQIARLLETR